MTSAEVSTSSLLLRVAAGLYGLALLILLSPVVTDVPYDGQVSRDGDFSSLCGLTVTHAFVTPSASDRERERTADCAAQASARVGYGFLTLALAAPFPVAAFASRRPSPGDGRAEDRLRPS